MTGNHINEALGISAAPTKLALKREMMDSKKSHQERGGNTNK